MIALKELGAERAGEKEIERAKGREKECYGPCI